MLEYRVKMQGNGDKYWYLKDKITPVEYAGGSDGKLHREDGPAVEWADGALEWYLHGKKLTEYEHERETE